MSETATPGDWRVADDYRAEWPDPDGVQRVLLDSVPDLFYVADRRGRMRDWNDQFREVLGYTDEEIRDLDPQQFFAESDRDRLADALDSVANGEEVTETVTLQTKAGQCLPYEFNTAPLTDDDGEVWGLVGIARDISERRERERELERYEQLLETVGEGMYVVDENRHLEWVNDALCELTGYDREELVGMHLDDDVYGEIVSRGLETELSLRDGDQEVIAIEGAVTRKDGEEVPVEVRFSALPGETGDATAGLVRDITDRKERDRELERYEQLLETVGEGMYILDEDRHLEWVNDQLAAILDYDREELVGKHLSEVTVPDSADRGAELRQQLLDGEIEVGTIEGEMIRADGSRLPSEGRFTLLDSTGDDGATTIGLVRDISDRVERAHLLENIHEATRELMTAETKQDVAETATEVAYEYTDIATAGVRLLQDDQLRMAAITTEDERLEEVPPPFAVGEGFVGEAYENGEPVVYDEGVSEQDTPFDYSPVESAMLIPIEGHGMINLASLERGAFDEETQELARLFAADTESALERADREERLREREQELQEYETLVETVSDGVYMSNEDYEFSMVNEALVDLLGYDSRDELLGNVAPEITADEREREKAVEKRRELVESDQQTMSLQSRVECADGSTRHVETRFSLLPEDDGYRGTAGVMRDITDRRERAALLKRLHEATRGLQTAETKQDVAERATEVAGRLGFPTIAVREEIDGELSVVAQSTDIDRIEGREMPPFAVGEGIVGGAYDDGMVCVYDDLQEAGMKYDPGPIRSAMFVPIEGYGMLSIASPDEGAFGEIEKELGRLFAADVESALERADREEQLRARERELQRQQAYTEDLLNAMEDVFYIMDDEGYLLQWNESFNDVTGYSDEEIEGMRGRVLFPDDELSRALETFYETLDSGQTRVETEILTKSGNRIPHEFDTSKLEDPDGNTVIVGIARDITERKAREEKLRAREQELEEQHAYTNDLLDAIDDVFYILDEDGYPQRWNESLHAVTGYTDEEIAEMNALDFFEPSDHDRVAEAIAEGFETGDAKIEVEYATKDGELIPHEFVASALEDPDGNPVLTGIGRDVTERREHENALLEREQELQRQRDELETLNRINELIQGTIRSMASAATREEIETTVCERLAASPFYRFAWTGRRRTEDEQITPMTSAGDGDSYLETVEIPTREWDGLGPGALALKNGTVIVVDDIETDPRCEGFRETALEYGFRSVAVVPFRHGKTVHGILALYADQPAAFSDRERRAFEVLGDMVGFAISAIQHRRLIEAETVLELEIDLPDSETFFAELARRLDCRCKLLGSVPSGDAMLHYLSVSGASADAVGAYVNETEATRVDASHVVRSTDDGCIVAVRVLDSTPELLQEAGTRTVDITVMPESTRVVARAPRNTDVRMLLDAFQDVHGDPELNAKREVERDNYTDEAFRADVADRLTDRQDAALSAAYFGGYFDWPRDSTAEEIAESLDISSATLHQHLRHAQHKLLEIYFDDTAARTGART